MEMFLKGFPRVGAWLKHFASQPESGVPPPPQGLQHLPFDFPRVFGLGPAFAAPINPNEERLPREPFSQPGVRKIVDEEHVPLVAPDLIGVIKGGQLQRVFAEGAKRLRTIDEIAMR